MNLYTIILWGSDIITVLSAASMCMYPMRHQFVYSKKKSLALTGIFLAVVLIITRFVEAILDIRFNQALPLLLSMSYLGYNLLFKASFYKKLYVFVTVAALMCFMGNITNGIDTIRYPTSKISELSLEASVILGGLSFFCAIITFKPFTTDLCMLVDEYNVKKTWLASTLPSLIFLVSNILIIPRRYETLLNPRLRLAFWGVLFGTLLLFVIIAFNFVVIVKEEMKRLHDTERLNLLEMQEDLYKKQQLYMDQTRIQRHDFRHAIHTLSALANENDLEGVKSFLAAYSEALPEKTVSRFTENLAVNALLNHYRDFAKTSEIALSWEIDLPKELGTISDSDFCGMLGNILENAIIACKELPVEERFIDLSIRCEGNSEIYVVAANSFSGKTNVQGEVYLTTRKHGNGIGLESVKATAEKYNGAANFSHEGNEFYSEVVLNMSGTNQLP